MFALRLCQSFKFILDSSDLEKKDEQFEAKAKEVLLLYKKIEWITQLAKKYDDPEEEIT